MSTSSSDTHSSICTCPACTSTDYLTAQHDSNAINDYHYDEKSGMLVNAQGLVISTSTAGYVQALFGADSAVWTDGGAGSASFGKAATVNYTFNTVSWANYYNWSNGAALDNAQKAAASAAMNMWSSVCNIKFVESSASTAKLAFHEYNLPAGAGVALTFSYNDDGAGKADRIAQVEVCVDDSQTGFAAGEYGYLTFIHEVGHSIGLKHPGNYNAGGGGADGPFLTTFHLVDSRDFTVMSYNGGAITSTNHPTTPMIYDIAAAQHLYGANTSYNATNTTYTLSSAKDAFCRWDGGGTDTLNASSYSAGAILDLREGEAYVTRVGDAYSWNAFGCNIENATGGSGADILYGNVLANTLTGNSGDDTLNGGAGNDILIGGLGNDTYVFGLNDGMDTVSESDGSGIIIIDGKTLSGTAAKSGASSYTLNVGGSAFTLAMSGTNAVIATQGGSQITLSNYASGKYGITLDGSAYVAPNNTITGTTANNSLKDTTGVDDIYGLAGNDNITSSLGADTAYGGLGNDKITMSGAGSTAYGDEDKDNITMKGVNSFAYGGTGNDRITGSAAGQTLNGEDGDDNITGGGVGTILNGGAGKDTIIITVAGATANGGDDADKISAKKIAGTMNGDAGNDSITGANGNDTIDGGADNDLLKGMQGNDVIVGGTGNDLIYGGLGDDTMTGGTGSDTFYFEKSKNGNDTITDFTVGEDTLHYAKSTTEATVLAAAHESGGDTIIVLNGFTLTLEDVSIADLTGHEFVW